VRQHRELGGRVQVGQAGRAHRPLGQPVRHVDVHGFDGRQPQVDADGVQPGGQGPDDRHLGGVAALLGGGQGGGGRPGQPVTLPHPGRQPGGLVQSGSHQAAADVEGCVAGPGLVPPSGGHRLHAVGEALHRRDDHRRQQRLLAPEVLVDGRPTDADGGADVVDPDRGVPAVGEQLGRGVDDLRLPLRGRGCRCHVPTVTGHDRQMLDVV
jgi:hypothetical protein